MDMEVILTSPLGSVPLKDDVLTIGRSPNNGLFINHATVSRHHAKIRPDGPGYSLVDLGSTSGTFVNGERLAPQTPRVLRAGDKLQVGSIPLSYEERRSALPLDAMTPLPINGSSPDRSLPGSPARSGSGAEHLLASSQSAGSEALVVSDIVSLSPISDGLLLTTNGSATNLKGASPLAGRSVAAGGSASDLPPVRFAQNQLPVTPAHAPSRPKPINLAQQQLHFTVFYQPVAAVESWHSLLVYAHIETALEAVRSDARRWQALAGTDPLQIAGAREPAITDEMQIMVVPVFHGVTFQPERLSFTWTNEWHPVVLRFCADPRWAGSTGSGEILLLAGPLVIASLRVTLRFVEPGAQLAQEQEEVSVARYKNIFTSYSQNDLPMAQAIRQAYEALGDESFQDIEALRAAENWPDILPRAIESADIFQLFWSPNAAQSQCVYQECQYALQHYKYDGFLRPIYWEKPLAFSPPELSHLPFIYYDLPETSAFASPTDG